MVNLFLIKYFKIFIDILKIRQLKDIYMEKIGKCLNKIMIFLRNIMMKKLDFKIQKLIQISLNQE